MGNSTCQQQCNHVQSEDAMEGTQDYPQYRAMHIKPPQSHKIACLNHEDDIIETLLTTKRQQTHPPQKKLLKSILRPSRIHKPTESIQKKLTSVMRGLANSVSVGHLHRHENTRSRNASCRNKSSVSQHHEEVPSHKLEQFLQKQRDFVEKRKKSIQNIRKLLQVQKQKCNPHKPQISEHSQILAQKAPKLVERYMKEEAQKKLKSQKNRKIKNVSRSEVIKSHPSEHYRNNLTSPIKCESVILADKPTIETINAFFEQVTQQMEKLEISTTDPIPYLIFVRLMQQIGMVGTQGHTLASGTSPIESQAFLAERQLLQKAWRQITGADVSVDCGYKPLIGFLMACLGSDLKIIGLEPQVAPMRKDRRSDEFTNRQHHCPHYSQTQIDQVYSNFSLFRMNKYQLRKSVNIVCQDYDRKLDVRLVSSNCQSINTASLVVTNSKCQQINTPSLMANNKENKQLKSKKVDVPVRARPTGRVSTISHKNTKGQTRDIQHEVFTTFNPQANGSSQSSLATSQQHPKTILQIDIDLGDRTQLVRVSIDDNPQMIASAFIKKHKLPPLLLPRLAALIGQGLGRIVSKSRQMSSGTI